jgi:hypothetical protein
MNRRALLQLLSAARIAPSNFAFAIPASAGAKGLLLRPQDFDSDQWL